MPKYKLRELEEIIGKPAAGEIYDLVTQTGQDVLPVALAYERILEVVAIKILKK